MPDVHRMTLLVLLLACTSGVSLGDSAFEYPAGMVHAHDADGSCWRGMDADGAWQGGGSGPGVPVLPEVWLVGPPPSTLSAVTIPEDHWVHLIFAGRIVDDTGGDIVLLESGKMGERAIVFLTDGMDQEYAATLAIAEQTNQQDNSRIQIDLAANPCPFVATGIRVVGVDQGGGSPGFDLASIEARIAHECGPTARYPDPPAGATGVDLGVRLSWTPACAGARQPVYFSPVESRVRSGSVQAWQQILPADANTFHPPQLRLGQTYYWRVDALASADANVPVAGDVWSFATPDHLAIDDFEGYLTSEALADSWECWGSSSVSLDTAGSQVCDFAMAFSYSYDYGSCSLVSRRFDVPQDWTRADTTVLQVLVGGTPPDPAKGEMYLSITDDVHEQLVRYAGPAVIDSNVGLYSWQIPLTDFSSIDLTQVRGMTLGICPRSFEPGPVHEGTIAIADIGLYPVLCPQDQRPAGDLNGDCVVDSGDLEQMATEWLGTRERMYAMTMPRGPVLWYTFNGHTRDSAGTSHGQIHGRVIYDQGRHGQAVRFAYEGDKVTITDARSLFAGITEAVTIAFWQYGEDSWHLNDTVCCSNYEYGRSNPAIAVNLGCWEIPGKYRWDCGYPWSLENRLAGRHHDKAEWSGRWNHWAFTKNLRCGPDGNTGRMEIYLNGALYDSRTGTDSPITGITSFEIGSGWYGRYDGLIDDFQIYDYALSATEVAWVATDGTGILQDPAPFPADLDTSGRIDLCDFALLAAQWLQNNLQP